MGGHDYIPLTFHKIELRKGLITQRIRSLRSNEVIHIFTVFAPLMPALCFRCLTTDSEMEVSCGLGPLVRCALNDVQVKIMGKTSGTP